MSSTISPTISSSIPAQITSSSVGKKILMAVTGFISFGYVVGHMLGNLQIFIGQDQINLYAEALHSLGTLLWVVRLFLLLFFVTHIWLGIQLKLENWTARPESYKYNNTVQATLSSRTMIWTGLTVFAFFVYHILQFTARVTNPEFQTLVDAEGRFDAYSMIVIGFQNPIVSIVYIVAMVGVAYHISHGISSMFQSLGWNSPRYEGKLKALAYLISTVVFIGFTSIPVAIYLGFLTLPAGGN